MRNSMGLCQFLLYEPAHPLWNLCVRSCNDLKQVLFHIGLRTDCLTNSGRTGWFQSTRNSPLLHLQAASEPSSWSLDFLTRIQTSVTCDMVSSKPNSSLQRNLFKKPLPFSGEIATPWLNYPIYYNQWKADTYYAPEDVIYSEKKTSFIVTRDHKLNTIMKKQQTNSRIFLLNFFSEFFKTIIVMKNKGRLRNCGTWKRWKEQLNKIRILQPLVEENTNAIKGIMQLTNWNVDGK